MTEDSPDPALPQYSPPQRKPAKFAAHKQAAPLLKIFKNALRRGKNPSNSRRRKKTRVV